MGSYKKECVMFKKEYFFVFALIGLSIVYVLLSLIVFLSRGKWSRAFHKKLAIGAMIIAFCAIINSQNAAYSQTPATLTPTPLYGIIDPTPIIPDETPPPVPPYSAPPVIIAPANQTVRTNEDFTTGVYVNSGNQKVAAYGMTVSYDNSFISVDRNMGEYGVTVGADGFVTAVNSENQGQVIISGFDASGKGPGSNLHMFTVGWTAGNSAGTTIINLSVDVLVDTNSSPIWFYNTSGAQVQIIEIILGDVNSDEKISIIDALLVAQYYVDLNPGNFNPDAADVDGSGTINVIDALLIARKYVGLIDTFPGE